jgi:hypothetical protein
MTMQKKKSKIKKRITISAFLLPLFCFGLYYSLTYKFDDYTKDDIEIIKGTLKQKPVLFRSKGGATLEFELNEYRNKVFSLQGVPLTPINYDSFVADNDMHDSIQISILKKQEFGMGTQILELKTDKGPYLTLKSLNEAISNEIRSRKIVLYFLIINPLCI